jgi:imidazolonepropionase-like amidohydrolase
MPSKILIAGGSVIDIENGTRAKRDVLVDGEKIVAVGSAAAMTLDKDVRTIDAQGKFIIPGLWDAHIHMTIWPEFAHQLSALLVANGITSVRDMGGQIDDVVALRKHNAQKGVVGPRMWIAGPIIDGQPHMAQSYGVEVRSTEEAEALVDTLVERGVDFVKLYEMLPPDVFKALVTRAQQVHQLPAAGHIPQRMTIAEVLDIGQYDIQHLGGTGSGMKYDCILDSCCGPDREAILAARKPEESGVDLLLKVGAASTMSPEDMDPEKIDRLIDLFVEKNTWHTPTLTGCVRFRDLGLRDDPFVTDRLHYLPSPRKEAALAMQDPQQDPTNVYKFGTWSLDVVGRLHKAGVKLLAGTDSPPLHTPAFCLHLELKAMVAAGLSPHEALKTATLHPAEYFGIENEMGSIDEGKLADIVLLDKDPLEDIDHCRLISAVCSRGEYYDRSALDALLASVSKFQ